MLGGIELRRGTRPERAPEAGHDALERALPPRLDLREEHVGGCEHPHVEPGLFPHFPLESELQRLSPGEATPREVPASWPDIQVVPAAQEQKPPVPEDDPFGAHPDPQTLDGHAPGRANAGKNPAGDEAGTSVRRAGG